MQTLYFQSNRSIGHLPGPARSSSPAGGRRDHAAQQHPDKRVLESEAGDVLVLRQERYRMLAVQRFDDWNGPWFASVRECFA